MGFASVWLVDHYHTTSHPTQEVRLVDTGNTVIVIEYNLLAGLAAYGHQAKKPSLLQHLPVLSA